MSFRFKVKKSQILSLLMVFIWFPPSTIINVNSAVFLIIQSALSAYVIASNYHISKRNKEQGYYLLLIYFLILITVTCYYGNAESIIKCIAYCIKIAGLFFYLKNKYFERIVRDFFLPVCLLEVFNVGSVILWPEGIIQNIYRQPVYLFGGKFTVFYINVFWIGLVLLKYQKRNRIIDIILCIFLALISWHTDCSTGILCATILALMLLFERVGKKLTPKIMILIMFGLNVVVVLFQGVLSIPAVEFIITRVLGRSTQLTGRLEIYSNLSRIYSGHWMFGYGYNNTVVYNTFINRYANVQNALLNIVDSSGIINCIVVVFIIYLAIKHSELFLDGRSKVLLWIILIVFFVIGTVEISFNTYFFFFIALSLGCRSVHVISEENGE